MNIDDVENTIRTALQHNVRDVHASTLTNLCAASKPRIRSATRSWALAAAVVLAVTSVAIASQVSRIHQAPQVAASKPAAATTWRLTSATTTNGTALAISAPGVVTISFPSDDEMVVHDGVNGTALQIRWDSQSFYASFKSTTYALDGDTSPGRKVLLTVLNSMANSTSPTQITRNAYRLEGSRFIVTSSAGVLNFERVQEAALTDQLGPPSTTPPPSKTLPAEPAASSSGATAAAQPGTP